MSKQKGIPYTNRELSWLDFNYRVLEEAFEKENPELERLKFLGISASNLDEFFMVRVAGLMQQVRFDYKTPDPAGLAPARQLELVREKVRQFSKKQYNCLGRSILPAMEKYGFRIVKPTELYEEQKRHISEYYSRILFPVLTPLAVDRSRPFPYLANKGLYIALRLKKDGDAHFAIVQVPSIMPRLVPLPSPQGCRHFIFQEDILAMHMDSLFEQYSIKAMLPFRITRNSDLHIDDDAEDLLEEIQESIKKRKHGQPVRLEVESGADPKLLDFLLEMLEVELEDVFEVGGPLDLTFCMKLASIDGFDELKLKAIQPALPADFYGQDDVFAAIRERDRMVYHPYESFQAVSDFLEAAANDKNVLAIKQTLYRVSGNSPIIRSLIKAAENGKQVTAMVELKARFDEENNIHWAKELEKAGCHVIYGLPGLKTHCKILLVVRREEGGIRRYLHLGTGNYNDSTAKLYTDIGMFTCKESFGFDASSLFNVLTGYSRPPAYQKMVAAPEGLRPFLLAMIRTEAGNARSGNVAGITIKVNSLVDEEIIAALYDASQAGVKIRLIVRGICCLVPGVAGYSENIQVISIVGRFLEHSRIFVFENGGKARIYMGSADIMPRNLDRRVELLFPVEEPVLRRRVLDYVDISWRDTVNARVLNEQGEYSMIDKRGKEILDSQSALIGYAKQALKAQMAQSAQENGR